MNEYIKAYLNKYLISLPIRYIKAVAIYETTNEYVLNNIILVVHQFPSFGDGMFAFFLKAVSYKFDSGIQLFMYVFFSF